LSTQGGLEHGGRYNPTGEFGALYAGENKAVCKAEIRRKGKDSITAPQVIGKLRISLTKVLDLTSTTNLKILGIEKRDLMVDMKRGGWDLTWNIARLAYRSGYEAIIAPSITSKGNGLIIFDKYIDTTTVKVVSKTHI
jgi:RES domain-containing protein